MTVRSITQAAAGYVAPTAVDVESISWDGSLPRLFIANSVEASPCGIEFKPDGTKLYHTGFGSDKVYEYDLSTAWDVSTATYSQSFSVATQETFPYAVRFSSNGSYMFVLGTTNDTIFRYYLSTAWDISTASVSGSGFSVATQETVPVDFYFKSDGTKVWVTGSTTDYVYEYTMSVAWAVHNASYSGNSFLIGGNPSGLSFKSDGTKMFAITADFVKDYSLSTAWDVSTASLNSSTQIWGGKWGLNTIYGLYIKSDGTKLYITEQNSTQSITEFDLSTAWDASTTSFAYPSSNYLANYVPTVASSATVSFTFNDDGTKLFVLSNVGYVTQWNLSTAYDIDTATYSGVNKSLGYSNNSDIAFTPDGTQLFVMAFFNKRLYRHTLSTAWDISTAGGAYSGTALSTWFTYPYSLVWSDDGYRVWISGFNATGHLIAEFSVTTPYFHGAGFSLVQSFYFGSEGIYPGSIRFTNEGKQLLVRFRGGIADYRLSTAWDISTTTYNNKIYLNDDASFLESIGAAYGLYVKEDQQKLLMSASQFTEIFQTDYVNGP